MLSFHNNPALKKTIIQQLEDQLTECELRPLIIGQDSLEIYGAPGRPAIEYEACSNLLGLPESLLRLMLLEADWCSYLDMKEAIRDTAKEALEFFQAVPVGKDLNYVAECYLGWLINEPVFGAVRYQQELGDLLTDTSACLASGVADDQLLQKINEFQEMAEANYLSLYDEDVKAACRWSKAGQAARFLGNIHYYLKNNTCISQDEIVHLLLMGISHVDFQEPDTFEVIAEMHQKLFSLLK